jgi:hypothetical protein
MQADGDQVCLLTGSNARARVDLLALVICFATTVAASVATTVAASAVPRLRVHARLQVALGSALRPITPMSQCST